MPGGFVEDGNLKANPNKNDRDTFDVNTLRETEEKFMKLFMMLIGFPVAIYISSIYFATVLVGVWFGWVSAFSFSTILVIEYLGWLKRRLDKKPLIFSVKKKELIAWKNKKLAALKNAYLLTKKKLKIQKDRFVSVFKKVK